MARARRDAASLRSNFEPGTSRWAVRRAQWRALGLSDADMVKPKIAVVNTSSEMAICFSHLDGIAARAKDAIRAAGGLPFEIRTAAPSDFIISAGRRATYILPTRDLIANDIEVQVEGAQLDGMLMLTSCDKTVPGQLMAAARLDIPTLMVICGYQSSGELDGEHVDIEEVFLHAGYHAQGATSFERLRDMTEHAIQSPGVCSGMGTANSMHSVAEALGMALAGAAPVAANSAAMWAQVEAAGSRIVDMVWEDLRPREILTAAAFRNAARVNLAQAGSINCIKHLQAIAVEAGVNLDVYEVFDTESRRVPVLTAVRPIGPHSIEAFEAAGGARGTMKRLEPLLETEALTCTGQTLAENLSDVRVADDDVIRPLDDPHGTEAAIVLLTGSLAPRTGIVKVGLRTPDRKLAFRGPARVFESSADAEAALKAGRIRRGEVLVLRRQGVRGGPGMGGASRLVFAVEGAGLGADVAVVTDGQLSGLVNKGLVVGEVQPEWADGGPIALVRDGDMIAIDVTARSIELEVPAQELDWRRAAFVPPEPTSDSGWLSIYERTVSDLRHGASLIPDARKKDS
ncbi:dihydroxy-acid dehydratase [Citreimonas salinaria]|uniref:Dihydroxyacid dehydratase n=1 Tax=Citreimonas salinaria TaxID=321339 RepID=A0A1H3LCC8_9RHOB|nr:dihydroxy-acid dehydratase [Citreimonas salinaria]SDY61525.1 dihydroxyacid dehydratase [Citreimonas salinaria]